MATGSSLTNGVSRTEGRNKSRLQWPSTDSNFSSKKESNQGDSDSDPALFTSSMHGSSSSATSSTDRYSSSMEGRIRPKKTPEKSNSKKTTGFWGFRASKRSPSMSLPDDGSAALSYRSPVEVSDASPVRKPVSKFSRSGSLRSLKIVRNRSRSSSESKGSTAENLRSNRATFSSILKDSKFPEKIDSQVGVQESEEILPVAKLCPYQHCSLHGHHHHHEPPIKRFSFLKRRSSKDQKGVNSKTPATIDKKKEVRVTKKGSTVSGEGKKKEKAVDFSIEFYEKTRSEPLYESSFNLDEAELADVMFGVNGNNQNQVQNIHMDDQESSIVNIDRKNNGAKKPDSINGNKMSMWRLIHRHIVSGLVAESGSELDQEVEKEKQSCIVDAKSSDSSETKCFDGDDGVNQENETRKTFAIKIVREAIEKILLPVVHDNQDSSERDDKKDPNPEANDLCGTEKEKPNGWSDVKKVVLLKRFITELEKAKKFNHNNSKLVPLVPEPEAETVSLRRKTIREKKNSDDWMLDYALQQVVSELAPNQKRKVALLVKAFESVAPKVDDFQAKESSFSNEHEKVSFSNGDYKEFDEKDVQAFDQEGNSKIDSVMKSNRRAIKENMKLDVSEFEKEKYIKMWHMIYQHVVADITSKVGSELLCDGDEQEVNDWNMSNEFSPRDADMLIRQSVNEILVPETQPKEVDGKQQTLKNWNKLRKLILLRKSIKALESSRKPKPQSPQQSIFPREPEGEKVDLRRQMSHEKTKAEQWMIDYAVQHIVTKLTPARKKRVSMLVEAFEAVIPLPET